MDFFHLPSSSNAANNVKQLVRRRAFPRPIVFCNCFANIVQNTQGGQCLQPTAIYNSHQFFSPQISAALLTDCQYSQRTSIFACFRGHCILLGAPTTLWLPKPFKCNVDNNVASLRGLLMSHGKAWLRQRWRMSISPVENKVRVSQPSCHPNLRNKANIGGLHSPHADTRCTSKSTLAPVFVDLSPRLLGHSARKSGP
jgi:hypothetical protein